MANDENVDDRARQTYRYVRIVVVVPAAWLILSIGAVWFLRGQVLDSISDYYGGPCGTCS